MSLPFKIYSYIWIVVIVLYLFGWSEFSLPLSPALAIFLVLSIAVSLILSRIIPKTKLKKLVKPYRHIGSVTAIVLLLYFFNFLYAGYVPLIGIVTGSAHYQSFPGIPFLLPLTITFSIYYYFVLAYYYFSFHSKKYAIQALLILFCILLIYSRSNLLFCILGTGLEWLFLKPKNKRFKFRHAIAILLLFIILVYMFGVLGNIRHGYAWNDCSYIEELGRFTRYPKWLSKQFMWGYLYIITPLANLNYNVIQSHHVMELDRFFVTLVPEFISNEFFPQLVTTSANETLLIKSYFNAQTTYVETYYSLGILGCYLNYIAFLILYFIVYKVQKHCAKNSILPIIALTIFFSLSFFYNVFYYTLPTMLIIWCILHMILPKICKYVGGKPTRKTITQDRMQKGCNHETAN